MSNLMLLNECTGWVSLDLNESSSNSNGRLTFRGKFQEANAVNKNKRMYPFDILSNNVEKLQEVVAARGLTGELDHPTDSIIHFKDASHLITKLWWEGNVLMGEGMVLNTPSGKVLAELMKDGVRIGISSRGVGNGSVNNEGVLVIGESYKLITFDAVADPSTFSAFQERVVKKNEATQIDKSNNYSAKNEDTSIHTLNYDALVVFAGQLVNKLTDELKNK